MKVKCEITGDLIGINDATRLNKKDSTGQSRCFVSTNLYRAHCRRRRASSLDYSEIRESIKEEDKFFLLVNELLLKTRKLALKNEISSKEQLSMLLDTEESYCIKTYKKTRTCLSCEEHIQVMNWLLESTELKLLVPEDKAREHHTPEAMLDDYLKDRYHLEVI